MLDGTVFDEYAEDAQASEPEEMTENEAGEKVPEKAEEKTKAPVPKNLQ